MSGKSKNLEIIKSQFWGYVKMSRQGLFRLFVWIEVVNDPNKLKVINLVCYG